MPSRNIVKEYVDDSVYHVYSRGVDKQRVFRSQDDYQVFLSLFKRYLSNTPKLSPARVKYPWYGLQVSLFAYCLMPNHIHLLVHQTDKDAMTSFMRSLLTSYSMYFNKKHNRTGPVFQSNYRAVRIESDSYYQHISRYIHMNPKKWKDYPYSSLVHYRSSRSPEWLDREKILDMFRSVGEYLEFLSDYQESKDELEELKWQLANYDETLSS